eukprot:COSAG02_NODE_1256_length_13576_cov_12.901981_9_plen_66_part_00
MSQAYVVKVRDPLQVLTDNGLAETAGQRFHRGGVAPMLGVGHRPACLLASLHTLAHAVLVELPTD